MNGIKYLVDTNCFIYFFNENPIIQPFINDGWAYSYITEIELLSQQSITEQADKIIREVLNTCYKVEHTQVLTDFVINLKRKYKIKLPDAMIAASAYHLGLPLLTADKGFAKITEIDSFILDF